MKIPEKKGVINGLQAKGANDNGGGVRNTSDIRRWTSFHEQVNNEEKWIF
jgi:hypothetical protein